MTVWKRLVMSMGAAALAANLASAQTTTLRPAPAATVNDTGTTVVRLRNIAALDAARAINAMPAVEPRAAIAPHAPTNTVYITGTLAARQRAIDVLTALDRDVPQIAVELRYIQVPAGFCERLGLKPSDDNTAPLSEREMKLLMAAVEANRECNLISSPNILMLDGQTATVSTAARENFVSAIEAVNVNGDTVFVPQNKSVELGDNLLVNGKLQPDGQSARLRVSAIRKRVVGNVSLVPVVMQITPVAEGGVRGKPVPFTQYLQVPKIESCSLDSSVVVPSGSTAVVGIWRESNATAPAPDSAAALIASFLGVAPLETDVDSEVIILATVRVVSPEVPAAKP